MLELKSKEWKEFRLLDLFDYKRGNQNNMNSLLQGNDMLISAKNSNNGLKGFFSSNNVNKGLYKGNCITLNNDGDGGVGLAYYQPHKFLLDSHVYALYPKIPMSKYTMIYITQALSKQRVCFSHGYSISQDRLKTMRLMLPLDDQGNPDYTFMEEFIREREAMLLQKYKEFIGNNFHNGGVIQPLQNKEWKEFFLTDIFTDIQRGKRLKKEDHIHGKMPYISSSALSNGVDNFVSNQEKVRIFSDCLTLANSGSVGSCYYQPFTFVASDHVTRLSNPIFNQHHYLFIATLISRFSEKYNFNREINDLRISREKIMLPVDKKGSPDYFYMEQYGKLLMARKYQQYLDYLEA